MEQAKNGQTRKIQNTQGVSDARKILSFLKKSIPFWQFSEEAFAQSAGKFLKGALCNELSPWDSRLQEKWDNQKCGCGSYQEKFSSTFRRWKVYYSMMNKFWTAHNFYR